MAIAHLKLVIDESGHGSVLINEIDISKFVKSIQFESTAGELTTVGIVIIAGVNADITVKLEKIGVKVEAPPQPTNVFMGLDGRTVTIRSVTPAK